jgi:hypothetical protein
MQRREVREQVLALIYRRDAANLELFLQNSDINYYINDPDQDGKTLLFYAVKQSTIAIVNILINYGAKIDSLTAKNSGIVCCAVINRGNYFLRDLLKNSKIVDNLNHANDDGCTALHAACYMKELPKIKLLLACDFLDFKVKDKRGFSAFYYLNSNKSVQYNPTERIVFDPFFYSELLSYLKERSDWPAWSEEQCNNLIQMVESSNMQQVEKFLYSKTIYESDFYLYYLKTADNISLYEVMRDKDFIQICYRRQERSSSFYEIGFSDISQENCGGRNWVKMFFGDKELSYNKGGINLDSLMLPGLREEMKNYSFSIMGR